MAPDGRVVRKTVAVAQAETELLANKWLRGAYTPKGIRQWWERPRHALAGRTPRQALVEGDGDAVVQLAFESLESNAT